VPNRVGDVDDGVALGSGDLLLHSGSGVLLFFLLSLFSLGLGGLWLATEVAAGDGTSARAPRTVAFIAELGHGAR